MHKAVKRTGYIFLLAILVPVLWAAISWVSEPTYERRIQLVHAETGEPAAGVVLSRHQAWRWYEADPITRFYFTMVEKERKVTDASGMVVFDKSRGDDLITVYATGPFRATVEGKQLHLAPPPKPWPEDLLHWVYDLQYDGTGVSSEPSWVSRESDYDVGIIADGAGEKDGDEEASGADVPEKGGKRSGAAE
jgi:hypothetical protein